MAASEESRLIMNAPDRIDASPFSTVSPATVHQYAAILIGRLAAEQLPELVGIIRVKGRWADPGKATGKTYYSASVCDDGGDRLKVSIPASVVAGRGIQPGQCVIITGQLEISTKYNMELKLSATDIELTDEEEAVVTEDTAKGRMTLDRLRSLPNRRNPFPKVDPVGVAVIQSTSAAAQVSQDFRSELDKLGILVHVKPCPVNMLDPVAIAAAIRSQPAGIVLVLIRGGGDAAEFAVFDDPRVVDALAAHPAHRVVGLGHTGNSTLLDLVADYSANTPGQAGIYIREVIEAQQRAIGDAAKDMRLLKERNQALEKARSTAEQQAKVATDLAEKVQAQAKSGVPLWAVAAAFIAGAVVVMLVR